MTFWDWLERHENLGLAVLLIAGVTVMGVAESCSQAVDDCHEELEAR